MTLVRSSMNSLSKLQEDEGGDELSVHSCTAIHTCSESSTSFPCIDIIYKGTLFLYSFTLICRMICIHNERWRGMLSTLRGSAEIESQQSEQE